MSQVAHSKGKVSASKTHPRPPTAAEPGKAYLLIRIRGRVNVNGKVRDTMRMLRVGFPNHAVVVPSTPANLGMIRKVTDYIAWGEVDAATVAELLRTRGRVTNDEPLTDEFVKKASENKYAGIDAFAAAVTKGEAKLTDLGEEFKPLFRLAPPRGGHGTIKRHVAAGGPLGFHGKAIVDLARRMM